MPLPITVEYETVPVLWERSFVLFVRFARFQTIEEMIAKVVEDAGERDFPDGADPVVICPLTGKLVKTPVRSQACDHKACFSLRPFVARGFATGQWTCPICNIDVPIGALRFDRELEHRVRQGGSQVVSPIESPEVQPYPGSPAEQPFPVWGTDPWDEPAFD
jgi:hypothetical protein